MIRLAAGVLVLILAGCGSAPGRNDGGAHDGRFDGGARDGWSDGGGRDGQSEAGGRDGQSEAGARDGRFDAVPSRDGGPEVGSQGGGAAVAFQIDVAHTGNQPASTLTPPLTRAWSVDLGDSTTVVSYPLIADGRVFVTTSPSAGAVGTLQALALATGKPLWGPIDTGNVGPYSNAAYDDGKIYVIIGTGLLTAFDAATGATVWAKQMPGQIVFSSPPTAAGGMVYLGGTGTGGTVYGVDGGSGAVVWTASVLGGDLSSPALSADAVFFDYACVEAYAFSRTDGTLLWRHDGPCNGAGGATPVLSQGQLWARDTQLNNNLILDATSGAELGSFSATVIPAFADQRGFFLAAGVLQALDVTTGTALWSFAGDGALASAPLVVNGVVYIGSTNGQLYALDPTTGTMLWSDTLPWGISPTFEVGFTPLAGLQAGGNALLVPAGNHLVCYR
ncbi:MAG TPA: PQQ-binding-like beta-propeller repeat protein [Polyangia bacterium]|nr:PQQ-binding-like beta-propeller repeat protein [Polyangia bacterium]